MHRDLQHGHPRYSHESRLQHNSSPCGPTRQSNTQLIAVPWSSTPIDHIKRHQTYNQEEPNACLLKPPWNSFFSSISLCPHYKPSWGTHKAPTVVSNSPTGHPSVVLHPFLTLRPQHRTPEFNFLLLRFFPPLLRHHERLRFPVLLRGAPFRGGVGIRVPSVPRLLFVERGRVCEPCLTNG